MKKIYSLFHQSIVYILLISLCLQSCGDSNNPILPKTGTYINEEEEEQEPLQEEEKLLLQEKKVLACFDGGGMRGILEIGVLKEVEKRVEEVIKTYSKDSEAPAPTVRLAECFDSMAGTSTGGIIALAMCVLDPTTNRPRYNMQEILKIYKCKGAYIFYGKNKPWKSIRQAINYKYKPKHFEKILNDYFGEATLQDLNKPVLITAYDTDKNTPYFFKSLEAKNDPSKDFTLKDVARATASPTTYFPPAHITTKDGIKHNFVDGGQAGLNNPTAAAYRYAKDVLFPSENFHIISLGTGTTQKPSLTTEIQKGGVRAIPSVIEMLLNIFGEQVNVDVERMLEQRKGRDTYTRLNFEIDLQTLKHMDDATPENINRLLDYAQKTIEKEKDGLIKTIVDRLIGYYAQREYYVFYPLIEEVRKQLQNGERIVDLSKSYLQTLGLPYVCVRATWELNHALSSLSNLTYLNLSGNKLLSQDNSLRYLKDLKSLTGLDLSNTDLNITGLSDLKAANLRLDVLKAYNNNALREVSASMIASKIENYQTPYFDNEVLERLVSFYDKQGKGLRKERILHILSEADKSSESTLVALDPDGSDRYKEEEQPQITENRQKEVKVKWHKKAFSPLNGVRRIGKGVNNLSSIFQRIPSAEPLPKIEELYTDNNPLFYTSEIEMTNPMFSAVYTEPAPKNESSESTLVALDPDGSDRYNAEEDQPQVTENRQEAVKVKWHKRALSPLNGVRKIGKGVSNLSLKFERIPAPEPLPKIEELDTDNNPLFYTSEIEMTNPMFGHVHLGAGWGSAPTDLHTL